MTQAAVTDLDFNSGEFGPPDEVSQELTPDQTNNVMAMLVNKHLQADPIAAIDSMFEVDRRMDIATFYREILKSPLFGTPCEASKIVEDEVRAFVRGRLEVLVGMKTETRVEIKSPFNEQETISLKALAKLKDNEIKTLNLILAKVLGNSEPKAEPSVSPVATPPARPVPTLVPRVIAPVVQKTIITQPVVTSSPVVINPEPPKRKPGRPPATVMVEDPNTGESIEMRVPKMKVVRNPNAMAMPTGNAMVMAQAIAAQNSIDAQGKSPIAQEILGKLGISG